MDAPKQFLLVGLPESGKTTFLAALWHAVESDEVEASLRLAGYVGDHKYLNQIRDRWLQGKPVGRTQTGAAKPVRLQLTAPSTDETLTLDIPDMNGEAFRDQWKDRKWTTEFDALAEQADGVLFFVHPDKIKESREIADIEHAVGDEPEDELAPDVEAAEKPGRPWSPEDASTQVVAVELLQFLLHRAPPSRPLAVAVVVSAWDLVLPSIYDGRPPEPARWVEERLPLLWQFLEANPERLRWAPFGVSAQGGDLESDDFKESLTEILDHARRVQVVSAGGGESHDVAAPLIWLME